MPAAAKRSLPCPAVRFEAGFARRLEELGRRFSRSRSRRESGGSTRVAEGGSEFVGYRPYAPGDDPRAIDWDLVARSRRAWVKVSRREAGEHWLVALDASASMGVGPPGKLQRAAEVAAGIAAIAVAAGSQVRIVASPGDREVVVARRRDLVPLLAFLETLRAEGARPERAARRVSGPASRVFLVGDLLDLSPEEALALASRGRKLAIVQILAPVEIAPPSEGSVEWWDPEAGDGLALEIDARTRGTYAAELEAEIERWRGACARHGVPYCCSSSASPFEDILGKCAVA